LAAKGPQLGEGAEERLLGEITGLLGIAGAKMIGNPVCLLVVATHEFSCRRPVALQSPSDQGFIAWGVTVVVSRLKVLSFGLGFR
jgi:hypothetical protein